MDSRLRGNDDTSTFSGCLKRPTHTTERETIMYHQPKSVGAAARRRVHVKITAHKIQAA